MLQLLFGLFSSYAHPFEKKADRFFRWVNSYRNKSDVERKLKDLMQENMLVLNVWLEKKYKNYHYLTKRNRRDMYANAVLIEQDFDAFQKTYRVLRAELDGELHALGLSFDADDVEKVQCLKALMLYFNHQGRFHYQPGTSFGKLLKNPHKEKLVGDCNQIVTLYAHLYSKKFPVNDLQIKLIPGHVCAHFKGIDIEATTGHFKHYTKYDYIAPITELISTNLLDINDIREATASLTPEAFVKSAQLAAVLSAKGEIVDRNLEIAYMNLGVEAMRQHDFVKTIFYLEKCKNREPLQVAYHNAAVFFLKAGNFKKAHFYADKKGDPQLKKACYGEEYNNYAKIVSHVKTIADAKPYKGTYQKMFELARKAKDARLEKNIGDILKKI